MLWVTEQRYSVAIHRKLFFDGMVEVDPADELRKLYPPILTTAHVAEMMHCTIGDVRDKVHRRELRAMRWGQQFRFFREEVIAALMRVDEATDPESDNTTGET